MRIEVVAKAGKNFEVYYRSYDNKAGLGVRVLNGYPYWQIKRGRGIHYYLIEGYDVNVNGVRVTLHRERKRTNLDAFRKIPDYWI